MCSYALLVYNKMEYSIIVARACKPLHRLINASVDNMPDLRGFVSSIALSNIVPWCSAVAWRYIYEELQTLSGAVDRGEYSHEILNYAIKRTSQKTLAMPAAEYYSFFALTYPNLTWCLQRTSIWFVAYALRSKSVTPGVIAAMETFTITKIQWIKILVEIEDYGVLCNIVESRVCDFLSVRSTVLANAKKRKNAACLNLFSHNTLTQIMCRAVDDIAYFNRLLVFADAKQLTTLSHAEIIIKNTEALISVVALDVRRVTYALCASIKLELYTSFLALINHVHHHDIFKHGWPYASLISVMSNIPKIHSSFAQILSENLPEHSLILANDMRCDRYLIITLYMGLARRGLLSMETRMTLLLSDYTLHVPIDSN